VSQFVNSYWNELAQIEDDAVCCFSLQPQLKDDYFFKSAENISFFFEEKAYGDDGCLKQAKEFSINKVGHGKYIHGAIRFSEKT